MFTIIEKIEPALKEPLIPVGKTTYMESFRFKSDGRVQQQSRF